MFKKVTILLVMLTLIAGHGVAQTTTTTDSSVTIYFVVCDTKAVVNFNGTMLAGEDIYYQVFSGAGATGTALTGQRRVMVGGEYSFSEVVNFDAGGSVAAGAVASLRVIIARETDASRISYETTVNDVQDGCADPQFATGTSEADDSVTTGATIPTSPIVSPFGGYLNPDYKPTAEEVVVIGARPTEPVRQQTPGLIFAECDNYPVANPGLVYDTDNVTVFWSWYASSPELVQDHIDNAIYEVGVFDSQPFMQPVIVSDIVQRGRNYWVFYTINLGNVKPGSYPIEFKLRWENVVSDGYENFGPGTANPSFNSTCTFTVRGNPQGRSVSYTFP